MRTFKDFNSFTNFPDRNVVLSTELGNFQTEWYKQFDVGVQLRQSGTEDLFWDNVSALEFEFLWTEQFLLYILHHKNLAKIFDGRKNLCICCRFGDCGGKRRKMLLPRWESNHTSPACRAGILTTRPRAAYLSPLTNMLLCRHNCFNFLPFEYFGQTVEVKRDFGHQLDKMWGVKKMWGGFSVIFFQSTDDIGLYCKCETLKYWLWVWEGNCFCEFWADRIYVVVWCWVQDFSCLEANRVCVFSWQISDGSFDTTNNFLSWNFLSSGGKSVFSDSERG